MSNSKQTSPVVGPNTKVELHFSIHLADGELVDTTRDKQAACFVYGDGNLLPGFEKCLLGMKAGVKRSFVLPPKSAFGEYNEENNHAIPRTQFDADLELREGLLIGFAGQAGEELPGLVKSFNEQFVMIDFNHPLAGKEVVFEAEVLSVEALDAETLVEWIENKLPRF